MEKEFDLTMTPLREHEIEKHVDDIFSRVFTNDIGWPELARKEYKEAKEREKNGTVKIYKK